jgi:hypothetical protein
MGNLAQPLLAALGAAQAPGSPTPPVGAVPPENGMAGAMEENPGMKMFGITPDMIQQMGNRTVGYGGGPNPDGSMSAVGGQGGMEGEEGVVRGFKPKKISFWGALGDQLLKHWGNPTAFDKRIQNKNMQRAMEGFTNDPKEAIARLAQIPGMEEKAWELLNKYEDNQRMGGTLERQNRALDLQNERIMHDRVAGMMNVANESNWGIMRDQAIRMGQARGVDVSHLIPPQYDPDSVEFIRHGTYKPKDYDAARDRSRNIDSQIERREDQTRQGDVRIVIAREAQDLRRDEYENPKPRPKPETKPGKVQRIKDSGGNIRVVEYNSDGSRARSQMPDGSIVEYVVDGNQLIKIKTIPPKGAK